MSKIAILQDKIKNLDDAGILMLHIQAQRCYAHNKNEDGDYYKALAESMSLKKARYVRKLQKLMKENVKEKKHHHKHSK